jgi:hypothetical protein
MSDSLMPYGSSRYASLMTKVGGGKKARPLGSGTIAPAVVGSGMVETRRTVVRLHVANG